MHQACACHSPGIAAPADGGVAADAGTTDSGTTEAGTTEAGITDAGTTDAGLVDSGPRPVAITTFLNAPSRSGVFADSAFTKAALKAAALDGGLTADPAYNAKVTGNVYGSPLFVERGVQGVDAIFVATEQNNVYAFDTITGKVLWNTAVGPYAHKRELGCGNIDPIGVTSTPAIDLTRHQLYLDAMTDAPDGGHPVHEVSALNLDTGAVVWSIALDPVLSDFSALYQNQRSALLVDNDTLFVPFGGHWGDCGDYRGRVVGIPLSNPVPAAVHEFATPGYAAAIWAPAGIASDGTSIYTVTGNAKATSGGFSAPASWDAGLGEAVLKIPEQTLQFSSAGTDYFVPHDWASLDTRDEDLSSNGIVLFDLPGAGSGHLAFTIGKTQTGWLLDRQNLGGLHTPDQPLASLAGIATADASGGMVAYATPHGTYVGFSGPCWVSGSALGVLKVTPGSPPTLTKAFCVSDGANHEDWGGTPIVTTSDGTNDAVVWGLGAGGGDNQLHAYDGESGAPIVTSSGLTNITHWITPIVAKGTMYVAGNAQIFAIRMR
jgi:outer membrane protein assembly factor BamB